jgi:hypothetical protein
LVCGNVHNDVREELKRLHKEELHYLYSSPNISTVIRSKKIRWPDMWHARMVEGKDVYGILVEKREGMRSL